MHRLINQKILQETTDTEVQHGFGAKGVLKAMQLGGFTSFLNAQMAQQVRASGPLSQCHCKLGQQAMQCAGLEACLAVPQDGGVGCIAVLLSDFHRDQTPPAHCMSAPVCSQHWLPYRCIGMYDPGAPLCWVSFFSGSQGYAPMTHLLASK